MSADRKRLTSALRRIVKTDPDVRSLLKAAESKGGKPGAAGVGSSTEAQQARVCCDGSIGDNPNPGTDERDPDSGGQTDGLNSSDPAKLDMGEGTLSGVTDCATGEPICFDGPGFIPPDGWDAPDDPPIDPTWEEGFYWIVTVDTGGTVTKYYTAAKPTICGYIDSDTPCTAPDSCSSTTDQISSGCIIDGTTYTYNVRRDRYTCPSEGTDPDADLVCSDPPLLDAWPSDSCTNLAIVNGSIVGSKYDPENDGSYSAPRNEIDLCSGTDQISLAPSGSIEGGWKTINSTNDSGYLYDSSGKVIAHIDGNEYSDPTM